MMSDYGLDGGTTFELAFDLLIDPSLLAGGIDAEFVFRRGVVGTIAGIGDDAIEQLPRSACMAGTTFASVCPS